MDFTVNFSNWSSCQMSSFCNNWSSNSMDSRSSSNYWGSSSISIGSWSSIAISMRSSISMRICIGIAKTSTAICSIPKVSIIWISLCIGAGNENGQKNLKNCLLRLLYKIVILTLFAGGAKFAPRFLK